MYSQQVQESYCRSMDTILPVSNSYHIWTGKRLNLQTVHNVLFRTHSEKSPARPMLFYSTNYWQQF